MRYLRTVILTSFCCVMPASIVAQHSLEDEKAAVIEIATRFGQALAAGDSAHALGLLHPGVLIYEGGHAETLAQYRAGHLAGDIAFLRAMTVVPGPRDALVMGDLALVTAESRMTGRFRDRDIDSRSAETMVLLRTAEGWRIRHIHWSSGR